MFNANNYGYNPYGRYIPQQPIEQQPIQPINKPVLNGKQVDSIEVVKAIEYPLDGSISYFPLTDGSAIVSKQLQMDGTSKTTVYKPVVEDEKELPRYITPEELKNALNDIDLSDIDDLKDDIKDLKKELKDLKKKKKDD